MKIIGIAGGSGSGKTTLARRLVDKYPDKIDIITLDKYRKVEEDTSKLPRINSFIDWDSPESINWDKLLGDIQTLQKGSPVTLKIWTLVGDPFRNPECKVVKSRTIYPKGILIVEGFLILWHPRLRKNFSKSYFLHVDQKERLQRRDRVVDANYDKEIHIPMHNEHVEPTKKYADVVLDVSKLDAGEVFEEIIQDLKKSNLLT